jgi:hypothetical protein
MNSHVREFQVAVILCVNWENDEDIATLSSHPAPFSMAPGGTFPGGEVAGKLSSLHLQVVLNLRTILVVPLLFTYAFMACVEMTLPLSYATI